MLLPLLEYSVQLTRSPGGDLEDIYIDLVTEHKMCGLQGCLNGEYIALTLFVLISLLKLTSGFIAGLWPQSSKS